jgi:hypothetical protein
MIRKRGKKHVLISKRTGRVLGRHTSRAAAERQERAIQISKARAAGHHIPMPREPRMKDVGKGHDFE